MSKAFTTDSDDEDDLLEAPSLPPGTRNYMTKAGAERLRAEMERLTQERHKVSTDIEGKSTTLKIDRRMRYLQERLDALEEIDPLLQPKDRVLFGATIMVSDALGKSETWRIVGLDEVDLDKGWISWMSPLASALLEKRVGDLILFMNRKLRVQNIV